MGLLDDAIREHLELKRRRGADPAEIARLEREALGPVRRGPEPGEARPDQPSPLANAASERWAEEPFDGQDEEWEHEHDSPTAPWQPAVDERAAVETGASAEGISGAPEPVAAPPPAGEIPPSAAVPRPNVDEAGGETTEHTVEDERGAEVREDADMLEETPEFLQDTPDHDRLWFEQRPPRDFDFDG